MSMLAEGFLESPCSLWTKHSINSLGLRKLEENRMSCHRLRGKRGQARRTGPTESKAPHVPQSHSGRKRRVNRTCGAPITQIHLRTLRPGHPPGFVPLTRVFPLFVWNTREFPFPILIGENEFQYLSFVTFYIF